MSEQTYKAIVTGKLSDVTVRFLSDLAQGVPSSNRQNAIDFVDYMMAQHRVKLMERARTELRPSSRENDLLNVYVEWDHDTYATTTTYVFSNRDTALMFKLARV